MKVNDIEITTIEDLYTSIPCYEPDLTNKFNLTIKDFDKETGLILECLKTPKDGLSYNIVQLLSNGALKFLYNSFNKDYNFIYLVYMNYVVHTKTNKR